MLFPAGTQAETGAGFGAGAGWMFGEQVAEVFPMVRGKPIVEAFNGMFSFTPDGLPILGESLDVRGMWSAEAVWVTHAGGAGNRHRAFAGQRPASDSGRRTDRQPRFALGAGCPGNPAIAEPDGGQDGHHGDA